MIIIHRFFSGLNIGDSALFSNNAVIKCDNPAAAGQKIQLYCQDATKKPRQK